VSAGIRVAVKNLTKEYLDAEKTLRVIKELSFEFVSATTTAIVGASGVGKSTLLHLLGGLDSPTQGEVWIGETSLSSLSSEELAKFRGQNIGFVFQFHHLLPDFTALENVAMPLLIQNFSQSEAIKRSKAVLAKFGLSSRCSHLPSALSGGEQQRVAIARAVVAQPPLIVADEPTGNLDRDSAKKVEDILLALPEDYGCTVIIVTHSGALAARASVTVEMTPEGGLEQKISSAEA
jgi:lipoprotein-releasing system ATP-binding protein